MNDNDPLIPEWMRQERERDKLYRAHQQVEDSATRAALLLIEKKAPIFWKHVLRNLKISVDALPVLGMTGFVRNVNSGFRVSINKLGPVANYTYTDIFLHPQRIHCRTFEQNFYDLRFCIEDSEIEVIGTEEPMDEEQTAEHIMRRMIDIVLSPKAR